MKLFYQHRSKKASKARIFTPPKKILKKMKIDLATAKSLPKFMPSLIVGHSLIDFII